MEANMEKREKEYTNLDQERIVTVSDLLKEILRRVGLVIILGIIVAALCCGYKYAKDSKAAKAANSEDTTTAIKLTDKEQTDVNNVIAVQDNMKEQQAYLDNSVLMQINAYDESRVTLQYRIITGDKQLSKDLLSAYDNYVTNGSLAQDMIDHGIDMDLQYLTELLYFEKDSDKDEYTLHRCMTFAERSALHGKVTAVMCQSKIITVQIFPRPVQPGQLTVARIFCGNIVSGIIRLIWQCIFSFPADMYRQINVILRHVIHFMCCNNYFRIHQHLLLFPPAACICPAGYSKFRFSPRLR